MANEAPAAPAPVDSKTVAANLIKGITDKAGGKPQEPPKGAPAKADASQPDPNAGKEKYLVNGKEYYLTPEQARAYTQKGIAFEPKVSELARLQNETAKFLETLKNNPEQVLFNPKIGLKPEAVLGKILGSQKISEELKEQVGKWYYDNVYKLSKMDPKDRELMERDQRIKEYEAKEKSAADTAAATENQARVNHALGILRGQIAESMKEIGLPNIDSPIGAQMAKRVADVMRLAHIAKKPITPKEAAVKVREEIRAYKTAFYDTLDEDKLVEELGKENAEKVRKHFLKIVKAADKEVKQGDSGPIPKKGERKTLSPDEFRDYLEERKRSGK